MPVPGRASHIDASFVPVPNAAVHTVEIDEEGLLANVEPAASPADA